jgi:acyl-CoA synthetase (AMP-forming)/AMP-acid ligase II
MSAPGPGVHPDRVNWEPGGPPAELTTQPTVGAALADRCRRFPESVVAYLYEGDDWTRVTAGDLWNGAVAVARDLKAAGVRPRDHVALCADTSTELLNAVYGCMLLGAAPFVAEPALTEARSAQWAGRFRHMIEVARPTAVFTAGPAADHACRVGAELGLPVLTGPPRPAQPHEAGGLPHPVTPDDTAYLQFSSGTTGDAKAVVMTHRKLLANVSAVGRHCGYLRGDCMIGWLPLHHDMGLVGCVFSTFLHSVPVALMPPLSFALRPERWLRAISYFRGTLSPAPNFAFQLCAGRISDDALSDVDLQSWRLAFNGAETVNPRTLRLWQERMGPVGFAEEAMQPCYGLAEVSLALSLSRPGERPRILHVDRTLLAESGKVVPVLADHPDAQALTAVGRPLADYHVRVVDVQGTDLPEYRQGQLLLSGPSLTDGYLTADGPAVGNPRNGWLHSGDLGFFADGELFVTGRIKDLIIIAGRNYLPYSLEEAAASLDGVRSGAVAALGIPHPETGTESFVLVAESPASRISDKAVALARQIERAVAERSGLRPDRVILVRPGSLPKTSSGKLQRALIARMISTRELA